MLFVVTLTSQPRTATSQKFARSGTKISLDQIDSSAIAKQIESIPILTGVNCS